MRLFLWPLVITVIMLFGFVEIAAPIVQHKEKVLHYLPVHKTLYLHRNIDADEIPYILEAAIKWNEATNGEVNFDIKMLPTDNMNISDSIVIMNVTEDDPQIILLDAFRNHLTLGYFNDEMSLSRIGLVYDRLDDDNFTHVMLHELGHALGISHLETDEGQYTLMYPFISELNSEISPVDLYRFCEIYHCDSSKYHGK